MHKLKEVIVKHKKIIIICLTIIVVISVITIFLCKDYNSSQQENKEQDKMRKHIENEMSFQFQDKIPNDGQLVFLNFFEKPQNSNCLTKNKNFRKSLYHCIDREKLNVSVPTSSLFTKALFKNNKAYMPNGVFSLNRESQTIYEEDNLQTIGYDFDKALKSLEDAWNELTPEEQGASYKIQLFVDDDYEYFSKNPQLTTNLVNQINTLFQNFIEKNTKLTFQQLQITTTTSSEIMNMRLQVMPEMDEYNEEDYFWHMITSVYNICDSQDKIIFDLSSLQKYLKENQNHSIIDSNITSGKQPETNSPYEQQYPAFSLDDNYKATLEQFICFHDNVILQLLPRENIGTQNLNHELTQIRHKTYDEIFQKILAFEHKQFFHIPLACIKLNLMETN
ncbi:hypothetical protein [Candidatus Phytoplasma meliae]|uniref:Uncharacterized protein n=1 Tax=Candidatus Phytoplasma meliae TaxID=1848402 RepID=A0ABS5CYP8_9MOLU|nr:hypothetical protein [Candidatus Phytoplasma meliae]MBP5836094.1 hypothetical protein [Candidatus Phytoplasma meliae]